MSQMAAATQYEPVGPAETYPQVDRRAGLTVKEFHSEYLIPGKPVVITDAAETWPARSRWTFDFFREHCGEMPVTVYRYDSETEFTPDNVEQVTMAEYVEGVSTKNWSDYPYYLRDNWKLILAYPELRQDYTEPPYFYDWFRFMPNALRLQYPRIFVGPQGAVTPLHEDIWGTHAWLTQLQGRKRWILFPKSQRDLLYNFDVRLENPDLERYPKFAETTPVEAVIGPGETIFAPGHWAHWVESLDATISITSNYMGPGCFKECISESVGGFVRQQFNQRFRKRSRAIA